MPKSIDDICSQGNSEKPKGLVKTPSAFSVLKLYFHLLIQIEGQRYYWMYLAKKLKPDIDEWNKLGVEAFITFWQFFQYSGPTIYLYEKLVG
ncbi:hypothetical protein HYY73_01530 [Candidatus Woesearchaeota archaeon]|nr:hypothetical protein [Candidatus Woesearchaeota archaeon]